MKLKGPVIPECMEQYVVHPGNQICLDDYDTQCAPNDLMIKPGDEKSIQILEEILKKSRKELAKVQEVLWSGREYAVLIILQGMDTSGKDGTIRHVMSGVNPQGCRVQSFKVPTPEEANHDFLWRCSKVLPQRGEIVIFNRSYYEDVLVTKVHPEILSYLPNKIGTDMNGFWKGRYSDINRFEKHLIRNGTVILKFFLHISKDEQKRRLLDRLNDKDKCWKFSLGDLEERKFWKDYQQVYEDMLQATSTDIAPWFIIPGDNKWGARTAVAEAIVTAIHGLDLSYPVISKGEIEKLMEAKRRLEKEE